MGEPPRASDQWLTDVECGHIATAPGRNNPDFWGGVLPAVGWSVRISAPVGGRPMSIIPPDEQNPVPELCGGTVANPAGSEAPPGNPPPPAGTPVTGPDLAP